MVITVKKFKELVDDSNLEGNQAYVLTINLPDDVTNEEPTVFD